jgi:hypothetical protein
MDPETMLRTTPIKVRLDNLLIFSGCSIAFATFIFFFSAGTSYFSFHWAPVTAILTIILHTTVLVVSRRRRASPDASTYPHVIMRPAIALVAFLAMMWLITTIFMIVGLIVPDPYQRYGGIRVKVMIWSQFVLAVIETGVLGVFAFQSVRVRKLFEADGENQIQI